MKSILYFTSLLTILIACGSSSAEQTPKGNTSSENSANTSADRKPLAIKQVIFFTPSSDELMKMMDANNQESAVTEAINDFEYYASAFQQNPGRKDLDIRFTDSKDIVVSKGTQSIHITRTEEKPFGIIMTDGIKDPLIDYNVRLDQELREMAEKYFGPVN